MSSSTLATWSATILRALEARGIDPAPIATQAGIDPTALGPDARVPRAALNRLWALAVDATGDPAFGLQVSRATVQTTFHALGYAVLASATLREAFERIIRYRRLIGDVLELRLVDAGDRCRFEIDVSAQPGIPFQAVDAIAATSVRQGRLLHRPRPCEPLLVTFTHPEPRDAEPYRRTFRAPVRFEQPVNALEYARSDLDRPLPAGNAELARANDEVLVRYLARLEQSQTATRVQRALLDALPGGVPSKPAIARTLGMSARTLQRQLAAEGTSFTVLVGEARIDLARTYVAEGRLSVTEIAFVLGFADTSTFSRAFKRWTGKSPRAYASAR
ncbi:MAG TPA: AraC family transcriptional regulator [Candidatus Binatia bacterium]|jgi:AraC-like DNA-binding protein|nr:AraC family transcriptional regulator [Candidatus Binatia bacterium]